MVGTTISHYRVTAKLGQGGMGEVYRATDTKLERDVAIKVLPESFAQDKERLNRFEREAKVLASLNHPKISAIHGLEDSDGKKALILELVEGETLAEKFLSGPLPLDEALDVCKQIAEAIEKAHEKGIVHRDLKPGNVKITPDGMVKVLDFGLAKLTSTNSSNGPSDRSESPPVLNNHTESGIVLGTTAYMSPEQARGQPVDQRSDIWSFGCILYECLTGKCMFGDEDIAEKLAGVSKSTVHWKKLPQNTPYTVQLLLRKCLVKDRHERLQSIGDARVDIVRAMIDPQWGSAHFHHSSADSRQERINGVRIASLLSVALLAAALSWFLKPNPLSPLPRISEIVSGSTSGFNPYAGNAFALSRDGTALVYLASSPDRSVRIRNLTTGTDEIILEAGDTDVGIPFFSWDGSSVGFRLGTSLVKIPVLGGNPQEISEVVGNAGAAWGPKNEIVFASHGHPLRLVSKDGGSVELTQLEPDTFHAWPQFLPDGEHVLFIVAERGIGDWVGQVEVVNTATFQRTVLPLECHYARYSSSGHLIYAIGDELFAIAFDEKRLRIESGSKLVLQDVFINGSNRPQFDVANDGTLIYLQGTDRSVGDLPKNLVWADTDGAISPLPHKSGQWGLFELSPDEKQFAFTRDSDIWVADTSGGTPRPLVLEPEIHDMYPLWSPDGESIYFYSKRDDAHGIWNIKADFSESEPRRIYQSKDTEAHPNSIFNDSSYLVLGVFTSRTNVDALFATLPSGQPSRLEMSQDYNEEWPMISPSGDLLAYCSDETGEREIYIKQLSGSKPSKMVSRGKGQRPRWSKDGRELLYEWNKELFSVGVNLVEGKLAATAPIPVLNLPKGAISRQWTVTSNKDRFLVMVATDSLDPSKRTASPYMHLTMVSNWFTELNQMAPTQGE